MRSRQLITVIMAFVALISQTGCTSEPTDLTVNSIIPKPVFVEAAGGTFRLTWHSDIYVQDGSEEMIRLGNYLADRLNPATGLGMEVISSGAKPGLCIMSGA